MKVGALDPSGCQRIQMRSLDHFVAVTREPSITEIIRHDEDHIGFPTRAHDSQQAGDSKSF
jgi:hypothetical protein